MDADMLQINETARGSSLLPFLINNLIYKGDMAMTTLQLPQSKKKSNVEDLISEWENEAEFLTNNSSGSDIAVGNTYKECAKRLAELIGTMPDTEEGCTCADHQGGPCAFCMEAKYNL